MTPATDSIAMVRWAWAQGAERRGSGFLLWAKPRTPYHV